MRKRAACLVAGLGAYWGAWAYTETFEGGSNVGGWTFGTSNTFIDGSGGNPGAYLHDPLVDTFAPSPATTWGTDSVFTGSYRAANVGTIGIDVILHDVDFSAGGRPLSLLLIDDNGTPSNFDDDWAVFVKHANNIPLVGQGWLHYDFSIDAQASTLPAGWGFLQFGATSPTTPNMNALMTDVDQLSFFYGDPEMFFIFQQWDTGIDNVSINPVPEPSTWLALGLLGLLTGRRGTRGRR